MIFKIRPKSYKKYLSLPILGTIIDEFTDWAFNRGYAIETIRNQIRDAKKLDKFFIQQGIKNLGELSQINFEMAWKTYRLKRNLAGSIRQIELFIKETLGLTPAKLPQKTPSEMEVDDYSRYLRDIRGYCSRTVQYHCSYIQEFLDNLSFNTNHDCLNVLTPGDIDKFIMLCSQRMNRYSLQHVVAYLRSFLKFKYERGILVKPLFSMIDTPRTYRLEKLPRSYRWETIQNLIQSIDIENAHGIRDYTIIFLMATYGLRASETTSLTLDDLDWRAGVIRIQSSKTKYENNLPMIDAVKEVMIRYLKESRPLVCHRELFISIRAPYAPLKRTAIHDILESRIRLSGLDIKFSGTHSLRHSYAIHLLRQGLSLKAIGDLLGHRDAESTCVYLRLAIDDLREVALEVPNESMKDIPLNIQLKNWTPPVKKNVIEEN
jgi:integrase/recombinase XerD